MEPSFKIDCYYDVSNSGTSFYAIREEDEEAIKADERERGDKEQRTAQAFNRIFEELPEEKGKDVGDKYALYLLSNEGAQEKIIKTMKRIAITEQIMVGTSGFFSLNLASVRGEEHRQQLQHLILLDCSERVQKFWAKMQAILIRPLDRISTIQAIEEMLANDCSEFWPGERQSQEIRAANCVRALRIDIEQRSSWLSSDPQFHVIKQIFERNQFVFKRVNFCNQEAMRHFVQILRKADLKIDTLYLSNIREYVEAEAEEGGLAPFYDSLEMLKEVSTDQTLVVDTKPRLYGLAYPLEAQPGELELRTTRKLCSSSIPISFPYSPLPPVFAKMKIEAFDYFKAYRHLREKTQSGVH